MRKLALILSLFAIPFAFGGEPREINSEVISTEKVTQSPIRNYSIEQLSFQDFQKFANDTTGATKIEFSFEVIRFSGKGVGIDSLNHFFKTQYDLCYAEIEMISDNNQSYIEEEGYGANSIYLFEKSKVLYTDRRLASVELDYDMYAGGVHGIAPLELVTFDLKSGRKLVIEDIIEDRAAAIKLLKEKLLQYLAKDYYFDFDNIDLNSNFVVLKDGIKMVYNQYEIASYAAGRPEVFFSFEEIEDMVKRNSAISHLL